MEISILGPGAVGTLLGGLLRLKGHSVRMRDRSQKPEAGGILRVVLPDSWLLVEGIRRSGPEEAVQPPEALLVTLGRHHVHALRRPDFLRLIGPGDAPVALFNCDPIEAQRLAVPAERLRFCLTLMNAVKLQEGDVELASNAPVIIYERSRTLERLFKDLASFGFRLVPVDDAQPFLNSLLVRQLLFLPVALCNTTLASFLAHPEGRQLASELLAEGFAAMEKAGLPTAGLPAMDPQELALRLQKKPGSFEQESPAPDRGYNSVLQSYLRGRPTEAAALNRRVVEIASSAGLHLTWNWRIVQKANRVSGIGFYRTPSELLKALV